MTKTLLWLDDARDPFTDPDWIVFSPIGKDVNIIWVQSYKEFVEYILSKGLPDAICFDHDLEDKILSGYTCAKWLVIYCITNKKSLPAFASQSANPIGRERIISLLNRYKNHINNFK